MASHRGGVAGAIGLVLVLDGRRVRPARARRNRRRAPSRACSAGAHTLSPPGAHVYPETGNGGYRSLHTDVHMVYDAPSTGSCPATTSCSPTGPRSA